ncbi:MAG: FtsX-like permease family protein, partial [Bacteroidota bacterium]
YLLATLLGLVLLGVLISGSYPAWILSSSQVSTVLKGIANKNNGSAWLRKILVVFQFTMSIGLIVVTWMVSNQIQYMSNQELGVKIDQVLSINSPQQSRWDSTFIDRMNTFKTELSKHPNIVSAATSSRTPGHRMGRIFQLSKLGQGNTEQTYTTNFINVDFEFAETFGIEPVSGRFFEASDHNYNWDAVNKLVLNQSAVEMLGYNDQTVLDKQLRFSGKDWRVIGVLPNYHQQSLHHSIEPILFIPSYSNGNPVSIHIEGGDLESTIAYIQTTYKSFFPGNTFDYYFLDEYFQRLYEAETRFVQILSFFTILAILVACLGLLGLASYTTYLRTKEIGIRKVLGATSSSIVALLSKDFLRLIAIAPLIAAPLAYLFLNQWLANFAYRTDINWWVFLLSGLGAILIAFTTISLQSIKAATANPVKSLRSE